MLAEGHEPTDELADEIKTHVRERHSAYAYPREIEFVDDLPKTLTGKIRRVELREAERERKEAGTTASSDLPASGPAAERVASRNCLPPAGGDMSTERARKWWKATAMRVGHLDALGDGLGFRKIRAAHRGHRLRRERDRAPGGHRGRASTSTTSRRSSYFVHSGEPRDGLRRRLRPTASAPAALARVDP